MTERDRSSAHVYLIDNDAGTRRDLSSLASSADLSHHSYESPMAFLDDYHDRGPSCIITDIRLPEFSGMQLLERTAEAGIHHPTIFLTAFADVHAAVEAFRRGAVEFFEKPANKTLILSSIQHWLGVDRERRDTTKARQRILENANLLSPREKSVLAMLLKGLSNKQIAWTLNLTKQTVSAHRNSILEKMQADTLTELILTVASSGLVDHLTADDASAPDDPRLHRLDQTCSSAS